MSRCWSGSLSCSARTFERKHQLADVNDFAFLRMNFLNLALKRGRNLNRRFVGHDFAERLVILHRVAWLHFPLDEFAFVYAFAQFRKFELHLISSFSR